MTIGRVGMLIVNELSSAIQLRSIDRFVIVIVSLALQVAAEGIFWGLTLVQYCKHNRSRRKIARHAQFRSRTFVNSATSERASEAQQNPHFLR